MDRDGHSPLHRTAWPRPHSPEGTVGRPAAEGRRGGTGRRGPGWGTIGLAAALVWGAPSVLGLGVLGLAYGLSRATGTMEVGMDRHPLLMLFFAGYALLFSPLLSWIGIGLALGPAVWLARRGTGWAGFLALGLLAGTLAGAMVPGFATLIAAVYGGLAALAFRWALGRMEPEVFAPRPPEEPPDAFTSN